MRRIVTLVSVVAMSVLLSAAAVLSADTITAKEDIKDNCLLASLDCKNSVDTIQQRIERLNHEIAKGTAVYTGDELRILNMKLENTVQQLEDLTAGG